MAAPDFKSRFAELARREAMLPFDAIVRFDRENREAWNLPNLDGTASGAFWAAMRDGSTLGVAKPKNTRGAQTGDKSLEAHSVESVVEKVVSDIALFCDFKHITSGVLWENKDGTGVYFFSPLTSWPVTSLASIDYKKNARILRQKPQLWAELIALDALTMNWDRWYGNIIHGKQGRNTHTIGIDHGLNIDRPINTDFKINRRKFKNRPEHKAALKIAIEKLKKLQEDNILDQIIDRLPKAYAPALLRRTLKDYILASLKTLEHNIEMALEGQTAPTQWEAAQHIRDAKKKAAQTLRARNKQRMTPKPSGTS